MQICVPLQLEPAGVCRWQWLRPGSITGQLVLMSVTWVAIKALTQVLLLHVK